MTQLGYNATRGVTGPHEHYNTPFALRQADSENHSKYIREKGRGVRIMRRGPPRPNSGEPEQDHCWPGRVPFLSFPAPQTWGGGPALSAGPVGYNKGMALHQFDSEDSLEGSLRAQRMTADEAQSVIALWQQERTEQTGLTDRPAVPDVAEGLNIGVEDVQRILAEVRARRLEEEHALAQEQELSEIQLAEEERKLAEIRRQRAELRREQGESERDYVSRCVSPRKLKEQSSIATVFGVVFLLFWLWCLFSIISLAQNMGPFSHSATDFGCRITMPDGTTQPCPDNLPIPSPTTKNSDNKH